MRYLFLIAFLWFSGQHRTLATPTIFDELYGKEVLDITLVTDVKQFMANKNTETYQPAQILFDGRSGREHQWNIEVRPRGRYRRRVCDFPPMKIKFPKKEIQEAGYAKHNDLKLVTHCLSDPLGDELVLREHLVYLLYQEVSPYAYRAQLVRITYIDNQGGPPLKRYGILLEDEDELAERYGMEICEDCYGFEEEDFERQASAVNQLFQQLIGNADWSLELQRNIKVLIREKDQSENLLFVPYDFDFSEVVNAPYQIEEPMPFPQLTEADAAVAQHFYRHRVDLEARVEHYSLLSKRARKQCSKRIEQFYRKLERQIAPMPEPESLYSGGPWGSGSVDNSPFRF